MVLKEILADDSKRMYTFEYNMKYDESDLVPAYNKMYLGILSLKDNMLQN